MCKTIITRTHTNYLTQDASWYKGESGNLVAENRAVFIGFYSADKNLQGPQTSECGRQRIKNFYLFIYKCRTVYNISTTTI